MPKWRTLSIIYFESIIRDGMYGRTHTKESIQKMKDAQSGDKHWAFGRTGEACHNYGRKHSLQTRQKMSKIRKGVCTIPPMPGRLNPRWRGYYITPEGVFETCQDAANHYGIGRQTVRKRCESESYSDWYITKEL